jgi:hypothetical protein
MNGGPIQRQTTGYAKNRKAIQLALVFALLSQSLFAIYLVYIFIVFFQPNQIVTGTLGLVSAVAAILLGARKLLPENVTGLLTNYVQAIYSRLPLVLIVIFIVWVAVISGSIVMRKDIIGRFVYVANLQKSMKQGVVDGASLPDSAALADAFATFPNRREVPFLLSRSSRLLLQANRRDLFRAFQKRFFDSLNVDGLLQELCEPGKRPLRADGLLFLVAVAGEAFVPTLGPGEVGYGDQAIAAIGGLERFVQPLKECRVASLQATVKKIRLQDRINELSGSVGRAEPYNIDLETAALDQRIKQTKDELAVLSFWQSHEAQEYLDFKAYRMQCKLHLCDDKPPLPGLVSQDQLTELMSLYETLLILRQGSLHAGDVIWNETPFKLNLFAAFMIEANLQSLAWPDQVALFTGSSDLKTAMAELTSRKAFEQFRTVSGWYAGTPLDFNLNGSAAADKIDHWLKSDW